MKKNGKSFLFWLILFVGLVVFSQKTNQNEVKRKEITFSEFVEKLNDKEIGNIELKGNTVVGKLKNDARFK
jgi:ATP-dependent Zn protease